MSLAPIRIEYRLTLFDEERGVDLSETLIVGQHPEETNEHLTLRVLAWCMLWEPRLELGAGGRDPDAADLWTHDLTGRLQTWIDCGPAAAEKIRKVVQHHRDARVHVVDDDPARRAALAAELSRWRRGGGGVELWTVDGALVEKLAANEWRRHKWAVTLVGGHLYLDADGIALDGAIAHARPD
jgi:uncharacterized protein YaeQ